jgi:hypothetical protein
VCNINEYNKGTENLVLLGIKTRGEFLAIRIQDKINQIEQKISPLVLIPSNTRFSVPLLYSRISCAIRVTVRCIAATKNSSDRYN